MLLQVSLVFSLLLNHFLKCYIVQAYDDEDPDLARRALASPFIKHMDVEYARLARDLQLPKGISTAPKANVIENATASYKSPNTAGGTSDVSCLNLLIDRSFRKNKILILQSDS